MKNKANNQINLTIFLQPKKQVTKNRQDIKALEPNYYATLFK